MLRLEGCGQGAMRLAHRIHGQAIAVWPGRGPYEAAGAVKAITIAHYRDKDGVEVDLVLERPPGDIAGIEVKAGATARPEDFGGLKRLKEAVGDRFRCGIVLHDGYRVQRIASRLFAMPIEMLWRA